MEQNSGFIRISEEVITKIALTAASETDGVARLSAKGLSEGKKVFGPNPAGSGVRFRKTEEGLEIGVGIIVRYGEKIQNVASGVQRNVADALTNMTGLNVCRVDVHVAGVSENK